MKQEATKKTNGSYVVVPLITTVVIKADREKYIRNENEETSTWTTFVVANE